MATKDWTFDISKLALGKPLKPVTFGGMPTTQPNPGTAYTPPGSPQYNPMGSAGPKAPPLPLGGAPSPTASGLGVLNNMATGGIKPVAPISPIPASTFADKLMGGAIPQNQNIATPTPAALSKGAMVSPVTPPVGVNPLGTSGPGNKPAGAPMPVTPPAGVNPLGTSGPGAKPVAAPPNTNVPTEQPKTKGAINAKTGEAIDPNKVVTAPIEPAPVSKFADAYTKALDTLMAIVNQDDPRYKAAVNQFITTSALMDNAERDALKMQINQDPNLRGQGAGIALMQVLNRNQNFNLDQGIAQLSNANLERIVNLQKYGLETGLKISEAYNAQKKEAFNTLLTNGQFEGAATTLQSMFDEQFPGLGLKVDAKSLESRDPFTLNQMSTKLDFIKDLAASNPSAALPIVQSMLADPMFKDYFPTGMTAEQVIQSLASGQISQNLVQSEGVQKSINSLAATGQSFEETGSSYAELFRLTGRNAVQEGRKLDLAGVNALRAAQGLPAYQTDASGAVVDDAGNPLDDQDYADLAYRKDYQDRVTKAAEKPWEAVYSQLLGTPGLGEKLLKPELYPGANDAVKKVLAGISLGTDLFYKDPQTGEWSLDMSKANLSESNPELQPYFQNWPTAVFDPATGDVVKDAAGKPVYTPGGYVYGEIVNGKPVLATPEDQALDQAYFAYRRTGGQLTPNEWYFATAAGKMQADEAKIPETIKPKGENFLNVGTPATGVTSTSTPGTSAALKDAKAKVDALKASFPASLKSETVVKALDELAALPASGKDYKTSVRLFYTYMVGEGATKEQANEIMEAFIGADAIKSILGNDYTSLTGKA